ncbi:MAG TPA: D-glycerate dehydrogenase [Candidatus Paceibacterota bacterium]|nr:D-glycerate dehydrogenase [Candidatus Paceibacterota bacterium]
MKHIYITRPIPSLASSMLRDAGFEVTQNTASKIPSPRNLIKALKGKKYDGVLSLLTEKIDASIFDAAPEAKIISNYAVGFNNIDVEEAKKRGVAVTNTPVTSEPVAEFTLALILALATRIVEGDRFMKKGKYAGWDPNLLNGTDLKGKVLALVGSGRIGFSVAERAYKALGMKIEYYDPIPNPKLEAECGAVRHENVDDLLKVGDYVSIHVPLMKETEHLIDGRRLSLMKPNAFLINTSRGPVVDEKALEKALKERVIRGAAIDVYEFEPKVSRGLRKLENVILTPHIASARESARLEMAKVAAQNIIDFFEGKKPVGLVG